MRVIKFRAWDKDNQKMWGDDLVRLNYQDWISSKDFILMQYTNLKDKNGKEIYSGDFVNAQDGAWLVEVENLEDGSVLVNHETGEASIDHVEGEYSLTETEVVGNKYENPELLKDGV